MGITHELSSLSVRRCNLIKIKTSISWTITGSSPFPSPGVSPVASLMKRSLICFLIFLFAVPFSDALCYSCSWCLEVREKMKKKKRPMEVSSGCQSSLKIALFSTDAVTDTILRIKEGCQPWLSVLCPKLMPLRSKNILKHALYVK